MNKDLKMIINLENKSVLLSIFILLSYIQLTWSGEIKLKQSTGDENYRFGKTVSIFDKYLIVGSPNSDKRCEMCGSASIFEYDGTKWDLQNELLGLNNGDYYGDYFGFSVSISNNYAIIGAYGEDINLISQVSSSRGAQVGSAYIWRVIKFSF